MNEQTHGSSFGERLKYFRKDLLKMKQKTFCETYGFPVITVKSWENNGIHISKRNAEKLNTRLRESGVIFDSDWLFNGIGLPSTTICTSQSDHETQQLMTYRIDSFCYEPLWKKNTELVLEPVRLNDINAPSLGAIRDQYQAMHFGILNQTWNKTFYLNAYQGSYYHIALDDQVEVFLIKSVTMP